MSGRVGVTAPQGWLAAGVRAGTKPSGDLDLALVVSEHPASVAGAFTTNKLVGAPIIACRDKVARGAGRGVVVSAGIANVSTGREGVRHAHQMAAAAGEACGIDPEHMLVSSTGTIGGPLPIDLVVAGIGAAAKELSPEGGEAASRAIMTTDTRPKTAVREIQTGAGTVTIGGMAKGAGMVCPEMAATHATTLAFITTDAAAEPEWLREVITRALPDTFNAISIDGSMSTSDTLFLFANGASGYAVDGLPAFARAVHEVMAELAYAVVADGEGATKVLRIRVTGAKTKAEARSAAREVANSILFRAAAWASDPNWGRVAQSIGQAKDVTFDPNRLAVAIGGIQVATAGVETGDLAAAAKAMGAPEVLIEADLGLGPQSAEMLTCDLTPDYVKFNADYTT